MTEILIDMEKNNLTITTSNADFISCHSLDTFDSLSTYILSENEYLILDLEAAEISTLSTSEKEFFSWFAKL